MAAPVLLREAITVPACGTATYSRAPHAIQCSSMSTTSEGSERVLFVMIPLPFLACCEQNQSILSRLVFFLSRPGIGLYVSFLVMLSSPVLPLANGITPEFDHLQTFRYGRLYTPRTIIAEVGRGQADVQSSSSRDSIEKPPGRELRAAGNLFGGRVV